MISPVLSLGRLRLVMIGLFAFAAALGRAELTPQEKAIAEWLTLRQEEMVQLLERSVKISSPTEDHAGVKAVGDLFAAELKTAGLTPRWIPMTAAGSAGHLWAERTGKKGQRVLLVGHLDTVLPGGKFSRDGDTARGSGVNDMKGGDVVLIYALKALEAAGVMADTQVAVVMTGDEEHVGTPTEVARRDLSEAAKLSDAVLAYETMREGEGTVARRGSSRWRLDVTGPTGHSSGVFSAAMGSGAIYEAARIIEAFHAELRKLPGLTCNVSMIAGGTEVVETPLNLTATGKDNIIPPVVKVRGDLRAMSPEQVVEAENVMKAIVAKNGLRTAAKIEFEHKYPPMASNARNLALLAKLDAVSRDLGRGPVVANNPATRGAGDAAFAAPYSAVLDGLGADGNGAHAERESVRLSSLSSQAIRSAILIYRLTR